MSLLDAIKQARPAQPPAKLPEQAPNDIQQKILRGRQEMRKDHNLRELCQKFFENKHYWYLNAEGALRFQTSGMVGIASATKPNYRIRNTYNWVGAIVEAKTSAATQRVPGYEVTPSTDDSDDQAAASLASQVATYGYDQWRVRRNTTKAVQNALVQREGFIMPYFDTSVGPFEQQPDGTWEGQGEVRLMTLTRSEVMKEPGVDFDDSRWYGIERARLREEVKQIPGYVPGSLDEDEAPDGHKTDQMVLVTEYLERPCQKYPQGRRCFVYRGRIIVDYRQDPACEPDWTDWFEPYPYLDADGKVADEPVIHRLSYTVNSQGDDLGLVERLVDLQRTVNDCWNKILEIKNRALLLQVLAPVGSNVQRRDDTPGATFYYNAVAGVKPDWEPAPDPQLLAQLQQIMAAAIDQMRNLAADLDVQADPRLSEGTVNAAIQNSQNRWQSFLGDLAEFHSRLMRHCLVIVARYYTSERQIQIRGQYGWQPMQSFVGQDLRSQVNIRVLPGSLEAKSRQTIQSEIQFLQANWPGSIAPEAALAAIHGGSYDGLLRSYENDIAKAWRIIRRLRAGGDAMNSFGTRFEPDIPDLSQLPDPITGQHPLGVEVPNWMPAEQDNITIWRQVIGDYMKTEDFESLDPSAQNNFRLIWRGLTASEQMRAAEQSAQQQVQAESLGMNNAAKPQMPPPLPDRAGFTPDSASPAAAPASPAPPTQ
jgi:hypothetical protein